MNKPLVSVIMNCYNSSEYLEETLQSVLAQTYTNWEIIFWDNQSTDQSPEIFQKHKDPRFKYFRSPEFTPLGQARNLAIGKAQGEFIAFLDCDDLWMPTKMEKSLKPFEDKKVGIVITDTYFFNANKEKNLYGQNPPSTGHVFEELLRRYYISLETVTIRMKALRELSEWFDPRFNMIEEMDLFIRLCFKWELAYVPEVLAKWRIHERSWTFQKMELFPVEREQFLEKMKILYPGFETKYAEGVIAIRALIAFERANICWKQGKLSKARMFIKPFVKTNLKYKIFYVFMFFPYKMYQFLNQFRSVGI